MNIKMSVSHDIVEIIVRNTFGDSVEVLYDVTEVEALIEALQRARQQMYAWQDARKREG